jgi:hypothetical protein
MHVRIWGVTYKFKLTGRELRRNGRTAAAMVRHRRKDILISVLVPRPLRASVRLAAVTYAWEHSPYAPVLAPVVPLA